jgi:hypothetical protein
MESRAPASFTRFFSMFETVLREAVAFFLASLRFFSASASADSADLSSDLSSLVVSSLSLISLSMWKICHR